MKDVNMCGGPPPADPIMSPPPPPPVCSTEQADPPAPPVAAPAAADSGPIGQCHDAPPAIPQYAPIDVMRVVFGPLGLPGLGAGLPAAPAPAAASGAAPAAAPAAAPVHHAPPDPRIARFDQAAGPERVPGHHHLQHGSTQETQILNSFGIPSTRPDGTTMPPAERVRLLQQKVGVTPADGQLGPQTAAAARSYMQEHTSEFQARMTGPTEVAEFDSTVQFLTQVDPVNGEQLQQLTDVRNQAVSHMSPQDLNTYTNFTETMPAGDVKTSAGHAIQARIATMNASEAQQYEQSLSQSPPSSGGAALHAQLLEAVRARRAQLSPAAAPAAH